MIIQEVKRTSGIDMEIVNRIGGSGALALGYLDSRPADGHTVAFVTPSHMYVIARGSSPLGMEDLVPLARATDDPQVIMVRAGGDIESLEDLVERSKEGAGLKWGTTHVGGIDHIAIHKLAKAADIPYEVVPFEGGAEVATNLVGGNIDAALVNVSEAGSLLDAGELTPVGVLADERIDVLGDVPTAKEKGYDVVASTVRGLVAPKDVPEERIAKLQEALLEAMQTPEYQEFLRTNGMSEDAAAGPEVWGEQLRQIHDDGLEVLTELGML